MTENLRAPAAANKPGSIAEYHAHIYYDPATTRAGAERLRQRVAAEFPQARLGRWHDALVGPHTQSMYQIAFPSEMLGAFVPWLMLNRDGLAILSIPRPATTTAITPHTPPGSARCCRCGLRLLPTAMRRIEPVRRAKLFGTRPAQMICR